MVVCTAETIVGVFLSSPDATASTSAAADASMAKSVAATVAARRLLDGRRCAGHSSRWWWRCVPAAGVGGSLLGGGWVKNGATSGGLQPSVKSATRMLLLAAALGFILPLLSQTHMPIISQEVGLLIPARRRELCTPTQQRRAYVVAVRRTAERQRGRGQSGGCLTTPIGFVENLEGVIIMGAPGGGASEKKKYVGVAREKTSRFTAGGRTAPSSSTMVSGSGPFACGMLGRYFADMETLCVFAVFEGRVVPIDGCPIHTTHSRGESSNHLLTKQ